MPMWIRRLLPALAGHAGRTGHPGGQPMLALSNADVGGARAVVGIVASRIVSVGGPPRAGEPVLDLAGGRLLPGLINAHDHLPLNHLPRLEPAPRYCNVREW